MSLGAFLSDLVHFRLKSAGSRLVDFGKTTVKKATAILMKGVDALGVYLEDNADDFIYSLAKSAVAAAETGGGTWQEKRDAAEKAVFDALKTSGKNFAIGAVTATVQAAWAETQAQVGG